MSIHSWLICEQWLFATVFLRTSVNTNSVYYFSAISIHSQEIFANPIASQMVVMRTTFVRKKKVWISFQSQTQRLVYLRIKRFHSDQYANYFLLANCKPQIFAKNKHSQYFIAKYVFRNLASAKASCSQCFHCALFLFAKRLNALSANIQCSQIVFANYNGSHLFLFLPKENLCPYCEQKFFAIISCEINWFANYIVRNIAVRRFPISNQKKSHFFFCELWLLTI